MCWKPLDLVRKNMKKISIYSNRKYKLNPYCVGFRVTYLMYKKPKAGKLWLS